MVWSFQKTATTRQQLFSFRHNKEECGLVLIKETRALLREEPSPPVIYFDLTFDAKGKETALTLFSTDSIIPVKSAPFTLRL